MAVGAMMVGTTVKGVITESRSGREAFLGVSFVDFTAYGDQSFTQYSKGTINHL